MYTFFVIVCTFFCLSLSLGQVIPSTIDGPHHFMVFDGTITANWANNIPMNHHDEYSFVWSANAADLSMYQQTNPQMKLSYYMPFSRDPENRDATWWQQNHPTWILYKCDRTPARLDFEQNGPIVLDISNPDVVNWQIENYVVPASQQGYSFVGADNFALGNAVDGCGVFDTQGNWVQKYSGRFGDDAYARDVTGWLQAFYTRVKAINMNLAINFVLADQDSTSAFVQAVTNNVDAIIDEAGVTQWGSGLNDERTWLNILNYMENVQSLGKAYFMVNEFTTVNQWAKEYAMASYFLVKNQAAAVVVTTVQGYGIETYMPEYANLNIGSPLAAKYKTQGLWTRQYSNGNVFVNAGTVAATFTVQRDSVDAFGGEYPAGTVVTVGPQQGLVLAYAPLPADATATPTLPAAPSVKPTRPPPAAGQPKFQAATAAPASSAGNMRCMADGQSYETFVNNAWMKSGACQKGLKCVPTLNGEYVYCDYA